MMYVDRMIGTAFFIALGYLILVEALDYITNLTYRD